MPSYKAPVDDVLFLLNDVFEMQKLSNLPGFGEATPDTVAAILREGAKLCEETLQPLNLPGDREGAQRHDDGTVTTPKGFKAAHKAYAAGGWIGLAADVYTDPTGEIRPIALRNSLIVTRGVQTRADLLGASRVLEDAALDKYVFQRDAYLQRRRSLVYDGRPPRERLE